MYLRHHACAVGYDHHIKIDKAVSFAIEIFDDDRVCCEYLASVRQAAVADRAPGVYPCRAAVLTGSTPMMPPAPGRVSMTNGWPSCALNLFATMRPVISGELPTAFETITRTGRTGYARSAAKLKPTLHTMMASSASTAFRCVLLRS